MTDAFERIASLSTKRLALLAHELTDALEHEKQKTHQPIAVVGLACRFPGDANDAQGLWQRLLEGADLITAAPSDRWGLDRPLTAMMGRSAEGGFLNQVDQFDPLFFGISPREAETMDPQQRLLLEVAWEALENAAISADSLKGTRTGVFVGMSGNDFSQQLLNRDSSKLDSYMASGGSHAVAAGRLSYTLDLAGPCVAIDTSCSSSLVAIANACDSLRIGHSDLALAGGVSLILSPETTIILAKAGMLSPTFRSRSFDAAADGFVRGEGCGMLVLKRLCDAEREGDQILAVVRGAAVNQDGRSSGLTAPSGSAQKALLRDALADAGLAPDAVQYVEAHGTGTTLGDPIEAQALSAVYGRDRRADDPLFIGSIKSNFGHLEAAAGVAGMIKLILSLEHALVPPLVHLKTPNPHVDWAGSGLALPQRTTPWPASKPERVGGVSSFGFSGTNAHLIVSASPGGKSANVPPPDQSHHLFCLSARSRHALQVLAQRYVAYCDAHPDADIADVCFTANHGRKHHSERLALLCEEIAELRAGLAAFVAEPSSVPAIEPGALPAPKIAFLFTGQGSQYLGMGRVLYKTQPAFAATLDQCDSVVGDVTGIGLIDLLFSTRPEDAARLDQTGFTQPALFALEVALARLLISWGIQPTAVMGHSVGEYAAACVAGVFSLEDGLRLIAKRGQFMQSLPPGGGMAAVLANESEVRRATSALPSLSIAAFNGPTNVVVSGPLADLDRLIDRLGESDVLVQKLAVSHAFHSSLLEPMLGDLERAATQVAYDDPQLTVMSNLTGREARGRELQSGAYWRDHARNPVRFAEGIQGLHAMGCTAFVEIGPAPVLTGMAKRFIEDPLASWLPLLRQGRGDLEQLLESVGVLYVRGVDLDFTAIYRGQRRRKLALPTYPFERLSYWPDVKSSATQPQSPADQWLYEAEWRPIDTEPQPQDVNVSPRRSVGGRWLIWADQGGMGCALAKAIRQRGGECLLVHPGRVYREIVEGELEIDAELVGDYQRVLAGNLDGGLRGIVHLQGLDADIGANTGPDQAQSAVATACKGALSLMQQALHIRPQGGVPLVMVVRGTRMNEAVGVADPAQAALWAMASAAALEHRELGLQRIQLGEGADAELLADALLQPALPSNQVRLTPQGYQVLRLRRSQTGLTEAPLTLRPDAAYLVTGGFTGLGLQTARWLAQRGARNLVLVGRRAAGPEAEEAFADLERLGVVCRRFQTDVGDPGAVARIFSNLDKMGLELAGLVHSAGTLSDGALLRQSWPQFQQTMRGKVNGAWNMHLQTRNMALDFFVLYSSGASFLGSVGQANYAAANGFLDGLASYRRGLGLPGLSVNWGVWKDVGMAAALPVLEESRRSGVDPIDPAGGFAALERLIRTDRVQAAVLPIDWTRFNPWSRADAGFFADFAASSPTPAASALPPEGGWEMKLEATSPIRRRAVLDELLEKAAARMLQLKPSQSVGLHVPLSELGMDSLMALQFRNDLALALGVSLPPTLLYNYPTLDLLAEYLLDLVFPIAPLPSKTDLSTDLDQFSEYELAQMLEKLIEND